MADITIADLLAIEPSLRLRSPASTGTGIDRIEVGWTVAARTTTPMLPALRGGELVLFGADAVSAAALPWPALMADLARLGASAVAVPADLPLPDSAPIPVLGYLGEDSPLAIEGALNRLLTELRGELYRVGGDLGRLLARLSSFGADPDRIAREAAALLGLPVRSGPASDPQIGRGQGAPSWHEVSLSDGARIAVGWSDARQAPLARLAASDLAQAVAGAVRRASVEAPRGAARTRGLERLLFGDRPDDPARFRAAASALGLSDTQRYRVTIVANGLGNDVARAANPFALAIDAGSVDGHAVLLLEARTNERGWSAAIDRIRDAVSPTDRWTDPWVAMSTATGGIGELPNAADEARSIARLFRHGRLDPAVVAFDDARGLGPWQLLLGLPKPLLRQFAAATLRELPARDRRGELRRTLEVFLGSGGATVEAARMLGVHRNTLAYRLRRIAVLTGFDPLDPPARLPLQLALMADHLAELSGVEGPG